MRKKCIAIAKKAMVWALAASMLVATPLTASAAGLRGVYSTTDGSGNDVKGPDGETTGDPSRTGTVTTTNTNTGALVDGEGKITGISINPSDVQLELDGEPARGKNQKAVTATILGDVTGDELEKLQNKLTWRVKDTSIATVDAKAADRTTANLTPWKGGDTVVEVTLDDYERNIHFKAEAAVHVKEYVESFEVEDREVYVNHTLDLNELIVNKKPASSTDTFTFGIEPSVKGGATVNAANVVTFKKECTVKVVAVSEKGRKAEGNLTVKPGVKSKKVTIYKKDDDSKPYTKDTKNITTEESSRAVEVVAKLDSAEAGKESTDLVAWTSNKTSVVAVKEVSDGTKAATLELKGVGKATITAKASSGKSAKLTLTVTATLTGLEIADIKVCEEENTAYTGQSFQVEAIRTPAENTEALKWSVSDKKIASINAKGMLTVKNILPGEKESVELVITVSNKKNTISATKPITIKQNKLKGFSVYEGSKKNPTPLIVVGDDGKQTTKGKKSTLNIPQNRTYTAVADGGPSGTLNWVSSNGKVASVVKDNNGKAVITPVKKGTATITVSGVMEIVNKSGKSSLKLVKATFKAEVKQPATTLTMNKPEVAVKNNNKKQTVSFSVKQNANAKDAVTWSIEQTEGEPANVTIDQKKGKVTFAKDGYKAGDKFVVTAKAASGITAKATIYVVDETNKVVIAKQLDENKIPVEYSYTNAKNKVVKKATVLPLGKYIELTSYVDTKANKNNWVVAGAKDTNTASVTYTANKKGIVQIVGNKVTRLKSGSVTITAKTSDGKSYKLKLD